ncbi:hypothetical protein SKAU_G00390880 [Synaphobranchus kaupii]|uniref:Uncharacterized protein n=1 Tax=Synaphobranchus kaupii TaxID=118154 RepID=A0A9Q1IDM3_SYNKA|nr:hypothetical protein SKAU_G00390880 [Synaphobranchus kaupii]
MLIIPQVRNTRTGTLWESLSGDVGITFLFLCSSPFRRRQWTFKKRPAEMPLPLISVITTTPTPKLQSLNSSRIHNGIIHFCSVNEIPEERGAATRCGASFQERLITECAVLLHFRRGLINLGLPPLAGADKFLLRPSRPAKRGSQWLVFCVPLRFLVPGVDDEGSTAKKVKENRRLPEAAAGILETISKACKCGSLKDNRG